MNHKKLSAVSEMLLVISMSIIIALFEAPAVEAAPVCCQKTTTNDYCQYVDESQCASDSARSPTLCDTTSFCKAGSCLDQKGDGACFANTPKARCELAFEGTYFMQDINQVPECKLGCCLIGNQAIFTNEGTCRTQTAQYPGLSVDFKTDVTTEDACSQLAQRAETGCCVQGTSYTYESGATCSAQSGTFHPNVYCSQLPESTCAPSNPTLGGKGDPTSTMCYQESVSWKDTCGNPEGVKATCDYAKGTLCADPNNDGAYTCESLDCKSTPDNPLSLSLKDTQGTKSALNNNIIRNGESYCLYDDASQGVNDPVLEGNVTTRSPVGSRYYRGLCINGQEIIEPCDDYRQQFCIAGTAKNTVLNEELSAARCVTNEWQSCTSACNTANPYTQNAEEYQQRLEEDAQCCLDSSQRDCSWIGNKCTPKVGPGFQFWQDQGADTCSQANLECPVIFACPGTSAALGACDPDSPWSAAATVIKIALGGALAAGIVAISGGTAGGFLLPILVSSADIAFKELSKEAGHKRGWHVISGKECLSPDFLSAANNLCRSYGDCGANVNYDGKISLTGFGNPVPLPKELRSGGFTDTPTVPLGSAKIRQPKDPEKVDANPGKLTWSSKTDSDKAWGEGTAFFDFTLKEKLTWEERFGQKFNEAFFGPFITYTVTGALAGFAGGGAAGALAGAGPLGKLIVFGGRFASAPANAVAKEFEQFGLRSGTNQWWTKTFGGSDAALAAPAPAFVPATPTAALEAPQLSLQVAPLPSNDISRINDLSLTLEKSSFLAEGTEEQIAAAAEEGVKAAGAEGWSLFADALSTASWVDLTYELVDLIGEQQKVEKISATCKPWVQPKVTTKDQCERCNPDYYLDASGKPTSIRAFYECTEYRCNSLGATCNLINSGTTDQRCVSTTRYDSAPPSIEAWKEGFDQAYREKIKPLPAGNGITLTPGSNDALPVYQKVVLALKTDQPAQCKVSRTPGVRYQDMEEIYFGSPTYKTTRRFEIFWPGKASFTNNTLTITKGGGEEKLYVRCENPKGVATESDFVIHFRIDDEPDGTAPRIITTSLGAEAYLSAGQNKTDVTLFTNEPAECKWSLSPQNYNDMPATNLCKVTTPNRYGDYECHFREGGTSSIGPAINVQTTQAGTTSYVYFKCKDFAADQNNRPKPNTMLTPYRLTLKGSNFLNITSITPSGDIYTNLATENITLSVTTTAGALLDGKALCKYTQRESFKNTLQSMDDFFQFTNASTHTQSLILPTGTHTFYAGCVDFAGNTAYASTTFNVLADLHAPRILTARKTDQPRTFSITIDEDARCTFSTTNPAFTYDEGNAMIKDGTTHSTTEDANTYYVKCKDPHDNVNTPAATVTFLS